MVGDRSPTLNGTIKALHITPMCSKERGKSTIATKTIKQMEG
jgi:hypothetical protein